MIEWLTFLVIMAVGQFSPGPDMVLLTRVSLAGGVRAGWATASGIACGLMIHAGIAVSGLAFVLTRNASIFRCMKYLACAYLLWLAYQLVRSARQKAKFKLELSQGGQAEHGPSLSLSLSLGFAAYWKMGFLCNILNPKVAIFLAGVTLPFLKMGDIGWSLLLWATIFIEGWLLWSLWGWLLQMPVVKHFYQRNVYMIDGLFGVCLVALAVILVIT